MSDEDDDAAVDFAFVAGGLQLGGVTASFSTDLTPPERRRRFHEAIESLKNTLDAYEPLASVFDLDDDRLIDASTEVHRALRTVEIEHIRVTGGGFPQSRDEHQPSWDAYDRAEPEWDTDEHEQVPPLEFGTLVPLDITLPTSDGTHRVRELLAYSTGVVITVESYLRRGDEEWRSWQAHYRSFMEFRHDHAPLAVGGIDAHAHGGSASGGGSVASREQSYWIPGQFAGGTVECEFRVADDERAPFTLDGDDVREAQSRARPI